jgi:L-ascorbate metabolism protein UlaG (beta-lactamase superfamily)
MTITKFGHACVRISLGDKALTIDPGGFTGAEAVEGVDAVLITHVHFDHYAIEHLVATNAPIYTIAEVAQQIGEDDPAVRERVTVVGPGQTFEAAGFSVTAVGELHAPVHPEAPVFFNSGYVVRGEESVYHPGDSFEVPDHQVDVLLAPISGPWLKLAEAVDFARAVKAPTTLAIHETHASDVGLTLIDSRMSDMLAPYGSTYQRLDPGEEVMGQS